MPARTNYLAIDLDEKTHVSTSNTIAAHHFHQKMRKLKNELSDIRSQSKIKPRSLNIPKSYMEYIDGMRTHPSSKMSSYFLVSKMRLLCLIELALALIKISYYLLDRFVMVIS